MGERERAASALAAHVERYARRGERCDAARRAAREPERVRVRAGARASRHERRLRCASRPLLPFQSPRSLQPTRTAANLFMRRVYDEGRTRYQSAGPLYDVLYSYRHIRMHVRTTS